MKRIAFVITLLIATPALAQVKVTGNIQAQPATGPTITNGKIVIAPPVTATPVLVQPPGTVPPPAPLAASQYLLYTNLYDALERSHQECINKGCDGGYPEWLPGVVYSPGAKVVSGTDWNPSIGWQSGNPNASLYVMSGAKSCTSGPTIPTGTGQVSDGACTWMMMTRYVTLFWWAVQVNTTSGAVQLENTVRTTVGVDAKGKPIPCIGPNCDFTASTLTASETAALVTPKTLQAQNPNWLPTPAAVAVQQ